MTPGADGKTIDGITLKKICKIQERVLKGTFKWGKTRRVYIPKLKGGLRPLGISLIADRLVQGVLKSILEAIYEPSFLNTSHGFRPGRSQHSALRTIRKNFSGIIWKIEGDISKCFDTISHSKLLELIKLRVDDTKFLNLISRGLKSRVLLPEGIVLKHAEGTPQGSLLSPLLSNIYLHQLDIFISEKKLSYDLGVRRKNSLEYNRALRKLGNATYVRASGLTKTDPIDPN